MPPHSPYRRSRRDSAERVGSRKKGHSPAANADDPIQAALQSGFSWLRFPAKIEAEFENAGLAQRQRHLFWSGLLGVTVFFFYASADPIYLPDVAEHSWTLRHTFTPFMALSLCVVWLPMRAWLREALCMVNALIISGVVIVLCAESRAPTAASHAIIIGLVPMFTGMVARLRFWYTVATVIISTSGFLLFIRPHTPTDALLLSDTTGLLIGMLLFTLVACYNTEHRERHAYLLARLEERQRRALELTNQHLRELSMLDPLTGINNRRQFDLEFEVAWAQALSLQRTIALLMFDVDYFKRYNDRYGHPEGDNCLRRIAAALRDAARAVHGIPARLGGEEFALLLPLRGAEETEQVADALCATIRILAIAHADSPISNIVTVSVGYAVCLPDPELDRQTLIAAADAALYRAKVGGRNRIAGDTLPGRVLPRGQAIG